jgi:hypothetical protein
MHVLICWLASWSLLNECKKNGAKYPQLNFRHGVIAHGVERAIARVTKSNFEIGQCVQLRRRHWLIEEIDTNDFGPVSLELRCLDDDATGYRQIVLPASEVSIEHVDDLLWHQLPSVPISVRQLTG